uniref:Zgc:173770 n=1 Tax=Sinocyclocheilus anshuiensis TaxID=1608454 RepID=A0A671RKN3_9TELE
MSNKLDALPLRVSSQSTSAQSSPSVSTSSTQTRYGTLLATSSRYVPVQGGSSSNSFSLKPPGTLGRYAPGSPTKYVSARMSSHQAIYSQTTSSGSSYKTVSQVGSLSQTGASGQFTSQGGNYYSGFQFSPGSKSSYASVSLSSPQAGPSTTVQGSRKQFTSTFTGSSGTQAGSSTLFTLQGSTSYGGSPQLQDTAGTFAPGSLSSYASVSLSSPQAVAGPSMVQSSRKQFTSGFRGSSGAQFGASTGFATERVNSRYSGVASQSSSQKQFTSASQRRIGASTGFVSQGMSRFYSGSVKSQDPASQFAPKPQSPHASVSLSSPQAGPSTTVQASLKQLASTFTGSSGTQAGSSTPFTLQGSTAYGGSPQDSTSQFAPGPQSPYASVSLSSPQAVAGPSTVQSSRKQFTSVFRGNSGAQVGASTGFAPEIMNSLYSGSVQSQDTASQFAPGSKSSYASVSLSSPQAGPSTTVQASLKQLASTYMGSSGTQGGSSTPFTLQGGTAYGGSPQGATSQFSPGSKSSYASVSLSSPQAGPSTTVQDSRKQFTSTFTGSSGTQAGSSTCFTLLGSTAYVDQHVGGAEGMHKKKKNGGLNDFNPCSCTVLRLKIQFSETVQAVGMCRCVAFL